MIQLNFRGNGIRFLAIVLVFFAVSAGVGYLQSIQSSVVVPGVMPVQDGGYGQFLPSQPVTMFATTAAESNVIVPANHSTSYGGRMVEMQGWLTIQVEDPKQAGDKATELASSLGGYVAESSFDSSGASSSLLLRIPEQNFTFALRQLASLGLVKAQSISSNDVTEQYVNLQAQLDAYKAEEVTLLRILNSSTTVRDALSTEDTIAQVQAEINDLEGQLLVMQRLVAYATINLELIQPPPGSPTLDLGDAVQSALLGLYVVVKGMMIVGASLLPIAAVGGIVYLPYRRIMKRRTRSIEAKTNVPDQG